jgi:AcrR family transcriptional regulator
VARDRILQAASHLFSRDGIRATGVDALIHEAQVAKATFYRHFPSKDELVTAWLQGQDARWIDWVAGQQARRASPPLQRLVEFWDVLGEWMEEHSFLGCPYIMALIEIRDPDHPARREVRSYVDEVESYLARTAKEAKLPEPEELGRRLRVIAMGACTAFVHEGSRAPATSARETTIELLAGHLGITSSALRGKIGRT